MKYLHFPLVALLLIILVGCSDGNVVAVDEAAETQSTSTPMTTKAAPVGPMKTIPFKGRWEAQPDPEASLIPCPDLNGNPTGVALPSKFIAQGQVTHLGRTRTVIRGEECWFNPSEGTITARGTATHTGANGDAIRAEYQNVTSIEDGTFGSDNIRFVGGTGRFEGVRGHASSQGTINLNTFTASFSIEGRITSVGASK